MRRRKQLAVIGINLLAWALSLILLAPLLLILLNSFKTGKAAADMNLALPASMEWSNYAVVIEKGKLATTFLNSALYSVCSVLLCTLLCTMAAYVLSRNRRKLHSFLYLFLVLGIAMPINFITLMKVMQTLKLMNSRIGIILLYTATQIPFNIFLIHSFVSKISPEIDEAAVIDGASPVSLFFRIVMPLMKPVLVTVMVLTFLNTWNEFVMPLYFLGSTDKWPMTLAVYNFFGMYFKDWNLVCADIVLTSAPVIIVYLLGQKYIVSGMTAGAIKG
jgi:raffinose/stachyose/melibiose transport system permease protein